MLARRSFLLGVPSAILVGLARRTARADDVAVPPAVQAQLIGKVAAYDKEFANRAGARAQVLVVVRSGDDASTRTGAAMMKELGALSTIGGLPHDETQLTFTNAKDLATAIKKKGAAIVVLTPGHGGEIDAIRTALDGVNVLSVSTVAEWVPRGVVLGFDLVSGKPKLLVHLGQAKKQNVVFKAEVLKLMRVYE